MNETLKVIKERRSTRKFKQEQITSQELEMIIEAGLYAPSAHNQQTWHFSVIQNQELIKAINFDTKEVAKNFPAPSIQKMASNEKLDLFYGAPTLIIVSGDDSGIMPQVDCAAASQNILIAAESLDLGTCWNGFIGFLFNGPKADEYKAKLNIPQGYTPYYGIAVGYKEVRAINAPKRKENTVQYIK